MATNFWERDAVVKGENQWWSKDPEAGAVKKEESGFLRQVADVPLSVGRGAVTGVRLIADAFGAGSGVSETIKGAEGYLASLMSAQAKNDEREIARIMKDAEDKGMGEQVKAAFQAFATAPVDLISQGFGTAAPAIVGLLGGKVLGAGALGARAISAGIGAGMGAGTAKSAVYEATKEELLKAGLPEAQAEQRAQLAQSYGGKNLDQILLSTGLGAFATGTGLESSIKNIIFKAGAKDAAQESVKKGALQTAKNLTGKAALEGVPEIAQGSQEQLAQNIALQREGFDVPTMRGVAGAGVLEGLAGAGLGVAGGAFESSARSQARAEAQRILEAEDKARIAAEQAEAKGLADAERARLEAEAAEKAKIPPLALGSEGVFTPVALPDGSVAMTREELAQYEEQQFQKKYAAQEADKQPPLALGVGEPFKPVVFPDGSVATTPEEVAEYEKQQFESKYRPQAIPPEPVFEEEPVGKSIISTKPQLEATPVGGDLAGIISGRREAEAAKAEIPLDDDYAFLQREKQRLMQQDQTPDTKKLLGRIDERIGDVLKRDIERQRADAEAAKTSVFGQEQLPEMESRDVVVGGEELATAQAKERFPETVIDRKERQSLARLEKLREQPAPPESEAEEQMRQLEKQRSKIKSTNLYGELIGKLAPGDVTDISPDIGKNLRVKGGRGGAFLSDIVSSGTLNDYLPPDMRPDAITFDEQEATEYIKDKLRNKDHLTFDATMESRKLDDEIRKLGAEVQAPRAAEFAPSDVEPGEAATVERAAGDQAVVESTDQIRYKRSTGKVGIGKQAVQDTINTVKSRWANAPEVVVAENMDDPAIPQEVRDHNKEAVAKGAKGSPQGFYYKGKAYVIADSIGSTNEAVEALMHEALGHFGLRGVFGPKMEAVLRDVIKNRRTEVESKAEQYGLDPKSDKDMLEAAEEVLAVMAQTKPGLPFVKRALAVIRNFLRDLGFDIKMSDADIIQKYILPARAFVESGKGRPTEGKPAASREPGKSGSVMFDPKEIEKNLTPEYKSRTKLIEMSIDDFLGLSDEGVTDYKTEGVGKLIKGGEKFSSLPFLIIDNDGRVEGHEGRHRARALKQAGYTTMPVILRSSNIRWSEQYSPDRFDYVENWPSKIKAEKNAANPNFSIDFPIKREDSDKAYEAKVVGKPSAMRGEAPKTGPGSEAFKRWSGGAPVIGLGDYHDFRSGEPVVVEALHGTTNSDLTEFKRSRANIESDMGAGFYASNTPEDVAANYASTEGPDLTLRVERLAELLEQDEEFEGDMDAARSEARQRLSQGAPNTMKLYMRFKNPVVLGDNETYLDYSESYNEETDEYGEPEGKLVDFVEALRDIAPNFNVSDRKIESAIGKIFEEAQGDSLKVSDIHDIIKREMVDAFDDAGGSASTEVFRRALSSIGFDGVIDTTVNSKFGRGRNRAGMKGMNEGTIHFIAFEPTQIKSATGNIGTYDPENADIRYQRENIKGQPVLAQWTTPNDTKLYGETNKDDIIYSLQNKMIDTKRVVDAISASAGKIMAKWNPYLQEELFHGRTAKQTADFLKKELRPLMQDMSTRGVNIKDFEEYLHNRHAEDYNKHVAKIGGMPDGGSGIDTADARAYLAGLTPQQKTDFEALAKKMDAINKATREVLVSSGYETRQTINQWEKTFPFYVPLKRDEAKLDYAYTAGGLGTGQGFDVRGKFSRSATGSEKDVVNILANSALQRERAIIKAEKNRVAQAMFGLALQSPNPDFWLPIDPMAEVDPSAAQDLLSFGLSQQDLDFLMKEPRQKAVDKSSGQVVERINATLRNNENVMSMRFNGRDRYVFFNPNNPRSKRMISSLKNLDADQLGPILGNLSKITRWFASVNTQYNPIFGAYNFLRDVQGAALQLSDTPLAKDRKAVVAGTLPALKGIYSALRAERDGEVVDSPWAKLWNEFQSEGGQTGFRDQFSRSQERAEALEKELKMVTEGKLKSAGRGMLNWLSDYNDSMENAIRLSAYKAALDRGINKQEAASIAKNLTVNFNRKGQIAVQAGALYAFFNAAVQGTTRLAQTLRGPAGKKIMAGGLLLGTMQAALLAAAGFDDEEPPEFVRERNLILPIGGDKYLTFPMPLGYHVIPSTSRIITEWALSGFKDTGDRIASLTGMFLEAFNPIGNAGWSAQTLAPTFADPIVALTENRDWTGKPIARKDFSNLDPTPGYTRAKDTASWFSTQLAKFLNFASGGTEFKPGTLSPTPDQIDYLIGQVTGGIGREVLKAEQTVTKTATGEELPPYKIPVVGRFYGETKSSAAESGRFYKNLTRLNEHENEIKGRRENREPVADYLKENPEARLAPLARKTYSDIQKLRKRKEQLLERDAPRESIKQVEEMMTKRMQVFNARVEAIRD